MRAELVRILLVALLTGGLAACGSDSDSVPTPVVRPVLSVVAQRVASVEVGPYVGDVEARYETPLSFQASGRIISRPVKIGDSVKAGERLATLDASVQQFSLASAQADLASAQSSYNNLAAAEERAKSLVATGAAPQSQLDQAVTARQTAEAQLNQAQASLSRAQDELSYTTITAGFDGVVISTGAEVGQVVGAGQTVVTIARPDIREAVFQLPEAAATATKSGDSWTVRIVGDPEDSMIGTVREISPVINGTTRSRTVKLALAAPPQPFRLGATVEVSRQRAVPSAFPLPATAVLEREGKDFVWIVDTKTLTVSSRPVVLQGGSGGDAVEVASGLKGGERVVTAGVHSLKEGQKVKLDGDGS